MPERKNAKIRIVDPILIRENKGQRKPLLCHILRNDRQNHITIDVKTKLWRSQ